MSFDGVCLDLDIICVEHCLGLGLAVYGLGLCLRCLVLGCLGLWCVMFACGYFVLFAATPFHLRY